MGNKYGANKVEIDGIVFDSKAEGRYYIELKEQRENGVISDFELQPKFTLLDSFEKHGKKFKAITYTADFRVFYPGGSTVVVDIKGFEPRDFPLRKKMFNYRYDEPLKIIGECPLKYGGGFIELDELKKLRAADKRKRGASIDKKK